MYSATMVEMLSQQIHPERLAQAEHARLVNMLAQRDIRTDEPVAPSLLALGLRAFAAVRHHAVRPGSALLG
jgi:hypothetical protein